MSRIKLRSCWLCVTSWVLFISAQMKITCKITLLFWKIQTGTRRFKTPASLLLLSLDLVPFPLSNNPTQHSPLDPGPNAARPARTDCWRHRFPAPYVDRWGSARVFYRQAPKTFRFSSCFSSLYYSLPTIGWARPPLVTDRGDDQSGHRADVTFTTFVLGYFPGKMETKLRKRQLTSVFSPLFWISE